MAEKGKQAADQAGDVQETASDAAGQATSTAGDAAGSAGEAGNGLLSELKDTASEAALAVLKPVVKDAAQSAATFAAQKGPELVKDKLGDVGGLDDLANKALSQAGPVGKVASKLGMGGKLVDNILPGGDDDDGDEDGGEAEADATGSGRRMPVQQAVDVAVPLEVAYNQWTQFEEYPNFMHRVDTVSQEDDANVTFTEKMWNFSRDFKAEIVEQRPNERIVWRSVNGLKHAGVVTFHQLAERLTRIEVTVDFMPQGFFEKIGRGARFSKRAIRADMHRFKAYVEMNQEEDGSWLGEIEGGEVVKDHEQAEEERAAEAEGEEQPEAEEEEQPEAEEEEQPEAEEEEQPEAEQEEEPEAEEEEEPEAEDEQEEPQAEEEEEPEAEDEQEEPQAEEQPSRRRTAQRSSRKPRGSDGGQPAQSRRRPSGQRSRSGGKRRSPQRPKQPQRRTARSSAR